MINTGVLDLFPSTRISEIGRDVKCIVSQLVPIFRFQNVDFTERRLVLFNFARVLEIGLFSIVSMTYSPNSDF